MQFYSFGCALGIPHLPPSRVWGMVEVDACQVDRLLLCILAAAGGRVGDTYI
jgi:hypothetical protein